VNAFDPGSTQPMPSSSTVALTLPLRGPSGEPVDLWCSVRSHGLTTLPPAIIDPERRRYRTVVTIPGVGPRAISIGEHPSQPNTTTVDVGGPGLNAAADQHLLALVRRMLALDLDLGGFYAQCASDPDLAWVTRGAGRMMRSPSVFEDVVKTICTTNCAWSGTVRMTTALVRHLGAPLPDANSDEPTDHAFPTPAAMAAAPEAFYRETVRAGYRGRYLQSLATRVADGTLDLESLASASPKDLPDDELAAQLLALPGVGPYAAAHVMLLLGRFSRLILDSWTRPTYARFVRGERTERAKGEELVPDKEIVARFAQYGPFAGLAFWLYITRDWHQPPEDAPAPSPVTEPAASTTATS
jgi:3-methyladenine DNA glycosylase/8-oxoguanine DNA glycosylase